MSGDESAVATPRSYRRVSVQSHFAGRCRTSGGSLIDDRA